MPPGCLVVADEAYIDYVAPEERPRRERDVADGRRVVVLRTFSKIFGLAGLRLGYALADRRRSSASSTPCRSRST